MKQWIEQYIAGQRAAVEAIGVDFIERVIKKFQEVLRADGQIFAFGNGGSAANASHFHTDMAKGASDKTSRRFRFVSLNEAIGVMTAIGNDYSYDDIFWRQLENYANPGDVVFTMSVSGNSPNLVKAVEWANTKGLHTIALVGAKRGKLAEIAKDVFVVPSQHYGFVEDTHMIICHALCYAFMENPEWGRV